MFVVQSIPKDDITNVPQAILEKLGMGLHRKDSHPLNTCKKRMESYFAGIEGGVGGAEKNDTNINNNNHNTKKIVKPTFSFVDNLSPIVSAKECFDDLLIPATHEARSPLNTYFLNKDTVLRPHTSAHQCHHLTDGNRAFLITGDVYRRDTSECSIYHS